VTAYFAASHGDADGTTEVAAFVVMVSGLLAGTGFVRVASGIFAITVMLLIEKRQLHGFVSKLDRTELRAGARFAVMAVVILPLLPLGPFGPWGGVRPRQLWAIVLLYSALSFLGYLARRVAGRDRGYAIAGTLGGLISSTTVTWSMAQISRRESSAGPALASGTLGANTVLFPRVLVASAVLAPALARAAWPGFLAPALIGILLFLRGLRSTHAASRWRPEANPLQFVTAIEMAAFFQLVLFAVWFARAHFGQQGIYASAGLFGLVEVDGLTISMAQLTASGTAAEVTARAVTIGILSNTVVKLGIALAVGRGSFRPLAVIGLLLMAIALVGAIIWI
jgi:uncharacterized membrane protein (DUF4010 family)